MLPLLFFQLHIVAYDTFYPSNQGMCEVLIGVIRNPSGPAFLSQQYVIAVPEFFTVGVNFTGVTAKDSDQVCKLLLIMCWVGI